MNAATSTVVHPDAGALADAIAARLITAIADAQAARGSASIVLTGGGIGTNALAAVAAAPAVAAVDWSAVDFWWGDERLLPAGDPERNEIGAREAMLDKLPIDPARVHPMPRSDGPDGVDAAIAAEHYAEELARSAGAAGHDRSAPVPAFDVLMLGVGPDGHVASLFPDHPALSGQHSSVVPVHDAPKPPPTRLSLTFDAINAAREVWLLVAGAEKAEAVRLALEGADPHRIPAAGVHGREHTRWLIDRAAASLIG